MQITDITFSYIIQCLAVLIILYEVFKKIMEVVSAINSRHDREQAWDKAVKDIAVDREALKNEFDARLDEQDAKIQQLFAMLCMSLKASGAILEALTENDIGNGDIKAMKKELNGFIAEQIK